MHTWAVVPGSDIVGRVRAIRCSRCDRESAALTDRRGQIDLTWLSLLSEKAQAESRAAALYDTSAKAYLRAYGDDASASPKQTRAYEQAITAYDEAAKAAEEARLRLAQYVRGGDERAKVA